MFKYIAFGVGLGATYLLLVSATKKTTIKKDGKGIAKFLMGLGYSKSNASGIAGNLYTESKYDPQALGDNGTSFGLAQWHKSRWDALKYWCNERNLDINSFEVQLRFIDWELNNTEKRAKRELLYGLGYYIYLFSNKKQLMNNIKKIKRYEYNEVDIQRQY